MTTLEVLKVSDLPKQAANPLVPSTENMQMTLKRHCLGASLVAQGLRIRLPMQGTRVRALVWEDPTCRGATGPVSHNY